MMMNNNNDDDESPTAAEAALQEDVPSLMSVPVELQTLNQMPWGSVIRYAVDRNLLLLVNIQCDEVQNDKDDDDDALRASNQLTEQLWWDETVRAVIQERFAFWQQLHSNAQGKAFLERFSVTALPHLAIIDPRSPRIPLWTLNGLQESLSLQSSSSTFTLAEAFLEIAMECRLEVVPLTTTPHGNHMERRLLPLPTTPNDNKNNRANQPATGDFDYSFLFKDPTPPDRSPLAMEWDLFAPPTKLIHQAARTVEGVLQNAAASQRWVVVNIQSPTEFASDVLNRDVWRHDLVQALILEGFLFWQKMKDTVGARAYVRRYNVKAFPHVAILHSLTGEILWRSEGWKLDQHGEAKVTPSYFVEAAIGLPERKAFLKKKLQEHSSNHHTGRLPGRLLSGDGKDKDDDMQSMERLSANDDVHEDAQDTQLYEEVNDNFSFAEITSVGGETNSSSWECLSRTGSVSIENLSILDPAAFGACASVGGKSTGDEESWDLLSAHAAIGESSSSSVLSSTEWTQMLNEAIKTPTKPSLATTVESRPRDHRLLLVNIQSKDEMSCHALNLDIWHDAQVQQLVKDGYVFCQQMNTAPLALRYMKTVEVKALPHVAIFDPQQQPASILWRKEGWSWSHDKPWTTHEFIEALTYCHHNRRQYHSRESTSAATMTTTTKATEEQTRAVRQEQDTQQSGAVHDNRPAAATEGTTPLAAIDTKPPAVATKTIITAPQTASTSTTDANQAPFATMDAKPHALTSHCEPPTATSPVETVISNVTTQPASAANPQAEQSLEDISVIDEFFERHPAAEEGKTGLFGAPLSSGASLPPLAHQTEDVGASSTALASWNLFAPPAWLIAQARTIEEVMRRASDSGRWTLVNLQSPSQFASDLLNRDVWSNEAVQSLILEGFVFYQTANSTPGANDYSQLYKVTAYPHVAILHSRTGQILWRREGWTPDEPQVTSQSLIEAAIGLPERKVHLIPDFVCGADERAENEAASGSKWKCLSLVDWDSRRVGQRWSSNWGLLGAPENITFASVELSEACEAACVAGRRLIVNIQSLEEASCRALDLDIWHDANVQNLVSDYYVFWQQLNNLDEAQQYIQRHQVQSMPHVAILDPYTGSIVWRIDGWSWNTDRPWNVPMFMQALKRFRTAHAAPPAEASLD